VAAGRQRWGGVRSARARGRVDAGGQIALDSEVDRDAARRGEQGRRRGVRGTPTTVPSSGAMLPTTSSPVGVPAGGRAETSPVQVSPTVTTAGRPAVVTAEGIVAAAGDEPSGSPHMSQSSVQPAGEPCGTTSGGAGVGLGSSTGATVRVGAACDEVAAATCGRGSGLRTWRVAHPPTRTTATTAIPTLTARAASSRPRVPVVTLGPPIPCSLRSPGVARR